MPWVPIAAAAISAAGSYAAASASGGKGGSSTPSSMWQNMPGWAQDKYSVGMQGMPNTMNIGFGGQQYPAMYGPFARQAKQLWSPAGQNVAEGTNSGVSSGLAAGMPWAMMAMNNAGMQGTGLQNYLNTNYYSPAMMSSMTSGASGYVPGWY